MQIELLADLRDQERLKTESSTAGKPGSLRLLHRGGRPSSAGIQRKQIAFRLRA